MKKILLINICILISFCSMAQNSKTMKTGVCSPVIQTPMSSTFSINDFLQNNWDISFQSIFNEQEDGTFHIEELKKEKLALKLASMKANNFSNNQNKTAAANPTIGTNFQGNQLKSWTPTDNSIAISNEGKIISVTNQGLESYDQLGNLLIPNITWTNFINDSLLTSTKFDPRVIYDPKHDRFVLVVLHGFSSTASKVVVAFSQTNDPLGSWNIYKLSGNPFNNGAWTDFPCLGLNDDDLFVSGNQFSDAPNYSWKGAYCYQIGLQEGYNGTSLQSATWNQITTPDGNEPVTMYPASDGQGNSLSEKMYFAHLMPDSGSNVYVYRIDGKVSNPNKTLTVSQFPITHFEVCANAFEKDPASGFVDSLSTGAAWVQNAFLVNKTIHFTFCAETNNGWCGVHYGRINLDSNTAVTTSIGVAGSDLAYPAAMSFGYDSLDQGAVIAYLQSDTSLLPQTGVVSIHHDMTWSNLQTVKTGDTIVNILTNPPYPIQPERWGDYTGICRKMNDSIPEVWMAGAYATNTPPRLASYSTWIAKITTNETAIPNSITSTTSDQLNTKIYPNPTSDLFVFEFENKEDGLVSIKLYDVQGKLVKFLFQDQLRKSMNRISFNKQMLTNGMYFVRLERNGKTISNEKLLIQ